MVSIDPKDLPVQKLHQYLLGAIGPRPIAFASTVDAEGKPNLAPFSFFNVFSANPPILIFSPARSGRTNTTKDTYNNVKIVPELSQETFAFSALLKVDGTSIALVKNTGTGGANVYLPLSFENNGAKSLRDKILEIEKELELFPPYQCRETGMKLRYTLDILVEQLLANELETFTT